MLLDNEITGLFKMFNLEKNLNDEVYFWHADKHRSFLQVGAIISNVRSQAYLKYPK